MRLIAVFLGSILALSLPALSQSRDAPVLFDNAEWHMLRRLYVETEQRYRECSSDNPGTSQKCERIRLQMENYKKLTSVPPL